MSQRHSHAAEGAPEQPPKAMEQPARRLRVLWGRWVALAFMIAMSFFAGWFAAPANVDAARLHALEADLAEASARIEDLESAGLPAPKPTPSPSREDDPRGGDFGDQPGAEKATGEQEAPFETYVVRRGDTLQGIADRFYEDPALDDVIAKANSLEDPALIHAGLKLEIPERPEL
jgi:nucleoid-associated protein YgaU